MTTPEYREKDDVLQKQQNRLRAGIQSTADKLLKAGTLDEGSRLNRELSELLDQDSQLIEERVQLLKVYEVQTPEEKQP